jgi:glycosyltransferase involved in cell wall biosynthesis
LKVFIGGGDGVGWALDVQKQSASESLRRLGHQVVEKPWFANLVLMVRWSPMTNWRYQWLRYRKTIILATNFIDLDAPGFPYRERFDKVNRLANAWISPSRRQQKVFERHRIRTYYQPFYPDDVYYDPPSKTREEICAALGIDYAKVAGRVVIGSIQRDTEGEDLRTPKWGKGPHVISELVRSLPDREKFVLLLSGPRRHYLLQECRTHGVPYVYAGREPAEGEDDLLTNLLAPEAMPLLYQLTDVYLVASQHEGGPKAVLEAALMKTFVFSTDVGLAPDFLEPDCIVRDKDDYLRKLREVVDEFPSDRIRGITERQYRHAYDILNPRNMDALLRDAIEGVCND